MKVFISTSSFGEYDFSAKTTLKRFGLGFECNSLRRTMREEEIARVLSAGQYVGLLAGLEPLTASVLKKAKGLRVISRIGTGIDNIDLKEARDKGILVFKTAGVLTESVAELTLALMLNCLRRVSYHDHLLRRGRWEKKMGALLSGKTVGVIGAGQIGCQVINLVRSFGAKAIFHDIRRVKVARAKSLSITRLLEKSDVISLHIAGQKTIIGKKELEMMKPGVVLINTSRGNAIDEKALCHMLATGHVAGAGLDVFTEEPYSGPLCSFENVVLTPHIGSYAKESRIQMERMAVDNCIKGLRQTKILKARRQSF